MFPWKIIQQQLSRAHGIQPNAHPISSTPTIPPPFHTCTHIKQSKTIFFNGDLIIFHLPKNAPGTVFLRHFTSGAPNVRLGTKCLKPQCQMLVIRECYWHSLIKQKKKHIRFEECYFSGYRQNSCSKTSVTGPSLWTLQYNSDAKIHVQVYERMKPL